MTSITSPNQAPTAVERLAAYGPRAALASGVVAALGTVTLFATFATQASTLSGVPAEQTALDRMANGLIGLSALIAIPVAFRLHLSWRTQAVGASATALMIGVVSLLAYGLLSLVLAFGPFRAGEIGSLIVVPYGGIGLWLLLVSLGRADRAIGGGVLRWLGVAIGLGFVFLPFGFFFGGGAEAAKNPALTFELPLLLVSALVSLLAGQIGYPIWAIWLSRRWRAGG